MEWLECLARFCLISKNSCDLFPPFSVSYKCRSKKADSCAASLVCRSGARSHSATEYLSAQGYDVANMVGGMLAWPGEKE